MVRRLGLLLIFLSLGLVAGHGVQGVVAPPAGAQVLPGPNPAVTPSPTPAPGGPLQPPLVPPPPPSAAPATPLYYLAK